MKVDVNRLSKLPGTRSDLAENQNATPPPIWSAMQSLANPRNGPKVFPFPYPKELKTRQIAYQLVIVLDAGVQI